MNGYCTDAYMAKCLHAQHQKRVSEQTVRGFEQTFGLTAEMNMLVMTAARETAKACGLAWMAHVPYNMYLSIEYYHGRTTHGAMQA